MGKGVQPRHLRYLERLYEKHCVIWAGFNGPSMVSGPKLVICRREALGRFRELLARLKIWHLDQMYKALQGDVFFTRVTSKPEILFGVRPHMSGCCNGHERPTQASDYDYCPEPDLDWLERGRAPHRAKRLASAEQAIRSALHNGERIKGKVSQLDTVALTLLAFLKETDPIRRDEALMRRLKDHHEQQRSAEDAKLAGQVAERQEVVQARRNQELTQQLQHGSRGTALPGDAAALVDWCRACGWLRGASTWPPSR